VDWEAIGAVGEILGALAVVVTLLYLARQIHQSNSMSRSQTASEIGQKFNEFNQLLVSNTNMQQIALKLTDPEFKAETREEDEQAYTFINILANIWITAEIALKNGQINEDFFEVIRDDVEQTLTRWPASAPYIKRLFSHYNLLEYRLFDRKPAQLFL